LLLVWFPIETIKKAYLFIVKFVVFCVLKTLAYSVSELRMA